VRPFGVLYLGVGRNGVWDLTGDAPSRPAAPLPEFAAGWDGCGWARFGSWAIRTGRVAGTLTPPEGDGGADRPYGTAPVTPRSTVESVRSRCQRLIGSLVEKCANRALATPRLPSAFSK